MCPCREQDRVVFILSDLDLVCMEGKDALASSSGEVWDKMAMHDPAGTMEMKSPEVWTSCTTVPQFFCLQCITHFVYFFVYSHSTGLVVERQ